MSSVGHPLSRCRCASSESPCFRNSRMSLLIREGWTSCNTKTLVTSTRRGRRNPVLIRGSGLPVMKNLTVGICLTNHPNTERIAEDDSSSLHSSRASITMTVGTSTDCSGPIINFSIWVCRDPSTISGLDWRRETRWDQNLGYLCASWKARVGNMRWRSLRSSKSREQQKETFRRPSVKRCSAMV